MALNPTTATPPTASSKPSLPGQKSPPPPVAPVALPTPGDITASDTATPGAIQIPAQGAAEAEHEAERDGDQPHSATGSLFAFAKPYLDQARPFLDQAAAQAKPYTDAAMQKGKELKEKIEGTASTPLHPTDPNDPAAAARASGPEHAGPGPASASGVGVQEKAKTAFGFGLASLQSAYNQVGAAIDAKTATPDKPGLFTQVSSAVQKGVQQINQAVVEPLNPNVESASPYTSTADAAAAASTHVAPSAPETATSATAAALTAPTAASGAPTSAPAPGASTATAAPTADSATAPGSLPPAAAAAQKQHPIMTTTNAVPHNDAAGDEALQ